MLCSGGTWVAWTAKVQAARLCGIVIGVAAVALGQVSSRAHDIKWWLKVDILECDRI